MIIVSVLLVWILILVVSLVIMVVFPVMWEDFVKELAVKLDMKCKSVGYVSFSAQKNVSHVK